MSNKPMAAKAEVSKETLSLEDVSALCALFDGVHLPLREHKTLFGGYSGTSIRVTGADGARAVLKIVHGYTMADAANQAAVAAHAASAGFTGVCAPLPLAADATRCVYERGDGTPVMMLSFVDGVAADKVLAEADGPKGSALLRSVGGGLAALHSVPVDGGAARRLRHCEGGSGACDVAKHMSGELLEKMRASAHTRAHPFLTGFYEAEVASLNESMRASELPRGLLHGDPFLDNMLVAATTGELRGLVDLEDFCVGPLLFDVACCASASCFRPDGALDLRRLRALLEGYAAVRPLTAGERRHFLSFMRLTMLCNWWAAPARARHIRRPRPPPATTPARPRLRRLATLSAPPTGTGACSAALPPHTWRLGRSRVRRRPPLPPQHVALCQLQH